VEALVRAAPDELRHHAPELARALVHCRVPEWVEVEAGTPEADLPDERRLRSLVALLAGAPEAAGDAVAAEAFSPHADLHQRLLSLDALAAAAQELSDPRLAPRLEVGPRGAPRVVYPPSRGGPPREGG